MRCTLPRVHTLYKYRRRLCYLLPLLLHLIVASLYMIFEKWASWPSYIFTRILRVILIYVQWTNLSLPLPPSVVPCSLFLVRRRPRHHRDHAAIAGFRCGSGLAAPPGIVFGLAGLSALSSRNRTHRRYCCCRSLCRRPSQCAALCCVLFSRSLDLVAPTPALPLLSTPTYPGAPLGRRVPGHTGLPWISASHRTMRRMLGR